MDFGIHIGTRGCMTTRENVMALATRAEAQGYAILGVADHVVAPVTTAVRYPYTADGIWPGAPTGECMDTLAVLLSDKNEHARALELQKRVVALQPQVPLFKFKLLRSMLMPLASVCPDNTV